MVCSQHTLQSEAPSSCGMFGERGVVGRDLGCRPNRSPSPDSCTGEMQVTGTLLLLKTCAGRDMGPEPPAGGMATARAALAKAEPSSLNDDDAPPLVGKLLV